MRNGRIEETYDGGKTWHLASHGLEIPWEHHMVERFQQIDGTEGIQLLAVLSNGKLLSSDLGWLDWRQILAELPPIAAVTSLQATE